MGCVGLGSGEVRGGGGVRERLGDGFGVGMTEAGRSEEGSVFSGVVRRDCCSDRGGCLDWLSEAVSCALFLRGSDLGSVGKAYGLGTSNGKGAFRIVLLFLMRAKSDLVSGCRGY